MEQPAPVVKGDMSVGTGPYAVADPSLGRVAHSNVYRVVPFDNTGIAVTSSRDRSEEHTSELQSLMRISYAVFCLKKKQKQKQHKHAITRQLTNHTHNRQ